MLFRPSTIAVFIFSPPDRLLPELEQGVRLLLLDLKTLRRSGSGQFYLFNAWKRITSYVGHCL